MPSDCRSRAFPLPLYLSRLEQGDQLRGPDAVLTREMRQVEGCIKGSVKSCEKMKRREEEDRKSFRRYKPGSGKAALAGLVGVLATSLASSNLCTWAEFCVGAGAC